MVGIVGLVCMRGVRLGGVVRMWFLREVSGGKRGEGGDVGRGVFSDLF